MGGGGVAPLKLIQLYSISIFINIEIVKGDFYGLSILKCESFWMALRRNSKKCTILLCTNS